MKRVGFISARNGKQIFPLFADKDTKLLTIEVAQGQTINYFLSGAEEDTKKLSEYFVTSGYIEIKGRKKD